MRWLEGGGQVNGVEATDGKVRAKITVERRGNSNRVWRTGEGRGGKEGSTTRRRINMDWERGGFLVNNSISSDTGNGL